MLNKKEVFPIFLINNPFCCFNFRVGPDAWSLMYPSIPDKLQSLYNDGYKLVSFIHISCLKFLVGSLMIVAV